MADEEKQVDGFFLGVTAHGDTRQALHLAVTRDHEHLPRVLLSLLLPLSAPAIPGHLPTHQTPTV